MGNKQNFFQFALLGIFGAITVISIIIVSVYRADPGVQAIDGNVTIWGPPLKNNAISQVINELVNDGEKSYVNVRYVEKHPSTMYADLLEAISSGDVGGSPDLVLINASDLLPLKNKLLPITYEGIPLHEFDETWVEGAKIFALEEGIYALPLLVDPLVLYWNRDMYANEAIAQVPKDWDTFIKLVPRLSKIENGADLRQSAVAFGEYDNVLHAKEIMSALLMQTGVKIVTQENGEFRTNLAEEKEKNPAAALQFYTSFANPVKIVYSWNKTYDRSREAFAANQVAMYGGLVSEEEVLNEINPNLNFGMSVWPQSNNNKLNVTYGNFYGIAIVKSTDNLNGAYKVALDLTRNSKNAGNISKYAELPSARRDVLTEVDPTDPFGSTKTQSAIISKSWYMPPSSYVDDSFANAINGIVSGTTDESNAIQNMTNDIKALLKKYN